MITITSKGVANKVKLEALQKCGFQYEPFNPSKKYYWCNKNACSELVVSTAGVKILNNKLRLFKHFRGAPFLPKTFTICKGKWGNITPEQMTEYSQNSSPHNVLFVKNPGLEKGKGIYLLPFNKISEFSNSSSENRRLTFVVQPHIPDVALIQGRKFDIRCYFIAVCDGEKTWYRVYRKGICRMNHSSFDVSNAATLLTNTTQGMKKKIPYEDLILPFDASQPFYADYFRTIVHTLSQMAKHNCLDFQHQKGLLVFGCDFIFDTAGRGYLLECNHNPALRKHPFHQQFYEKVARENILALYTMGTIKDSYWFFDIPILT